MHISLAHVNPKCFERSKQTQVVPTSTTNGDANDRLITAAFCSMWFIGMEFKKMENLNVDLTENIQNFTNLVHKHATSISLQKEGMEIEVRHVRRKQLSTYVDKDILNRERKSMDANATAPTTPTSTTIPTVSSAKKRVSTESTTPSKSPAKRPRTNEYVSS